MHWTERAPGRLEYEVARLAALGFDAEVDDELANRTAPGSLTVRIPAQEGEPSTFRVTFSAFYPETPPLVQVVDGEWRRLRHVTEFDGTVCLVHDALTHWDTHCTIAWLLTEQRAHVLAANRADEDHASVPEVAGAEPVIGSYPPGPGCLLLTDGAWAPEGTSGTVDLYVKVSADEQGLARLRGWALRFRDGDAVHEHALADRFNGDNLLTVPWVWLDEPPRPVDDPRAVFEQVSRTCQRPPREFPLDKQTGKKRSWRAALAVFPDEAGGDRHRTRSWLLVVEVGERIGGQRGGIKPIGHVLVPASPFGHDDARARTPETRNLTHKSVLLIGAGAVGGSVAHQLAKAGIGELDFVDGDNVEASQTPRWPVGLLAAGYPKVRALGDFLAANWPHTRVRPRTWFVGHALPPERRPSEAADEDAWLQERIADCDVVVDATTEVTVQNVLADTADAQGRPFIAAYATPGAWGGRVVRVMPHDQGCWTCYRHWSNGDAPGGPDSPATDPDGQVQPDSCAAPTYTGLSVDLDEIATQAVRSTIEALHGSARSGVATLSLRDAQGDRTLPSWTWWDFQAHADCREHHAWAA